ncbi:SLBB domain-containing protein [Tumidithrix elongata RA019]|uniref:SLBB domain-containing protein n=1 Tax=Tumidithrix elongata BACA0141 TaxID=2716417 RepID=A0AAW9PQC3_9CYAN|nr:SLBB domain-containing protein [Tumidithrix elongata RA019]
MKLWLDLRQLSNTIPLLCVLGFPTSVLAQSTIKPSLKPTSQPSAQVPPQPSTTPVPPLPATPSNLLDSAGLNAPSLNVGSPVEIESYILGSGDSLKIDIFNVPELSGIQAIAPDGTINISLVGAIKVEGLSIVEATNVLRAKLAPYLVRNIVNLSLASPRPVNIALVGEVNRPGTLQLVYTATGVQAATLTRALNAASGVTSRADISNIQVSRSEGGGRRRLIKINLLDLLQRGDVSQDIRILDGDSILVPRIADVAVSQPRTVGNSSFSPDTFSIQVVLAGEVNRVGAQTLTYSRNGTTPTGLTGATGQAGQAGIGGPTTISRALQAAGGITEIADIRNIQVSRLDSNGGRSTFTVNLLELITKADITQDVQLVDGDTITVPKLAKLNPTEYGLIAKATFSPTTINVQMVGELVRPGLLQLRPNARFTEAITAAGGITNNGDWRAVELYHLNPDGTVTRRDLTADLNLPLNEESNPGLRDRDVIVVRPSFGAGILQSVTKFLGDIVTPFALINNLFK